MQTEVRALENWFKKVARPLPWRKTHDPYRIWISEVMLQQTQVQAVIPYYERFLAELPTLKALAEAPEEQVLRLWSGLGYYSRARNLQKGAIYIQEELRGKFPVIREEILKVPGVGPYTAGAILSIAYDLKEPLVDGNVMRVFARFFGIRKPIENKDVQKIFWEKADLWVSLARSPRMLNQALMELGATVCTKGSPRCSQCPLQKTCVAFKKDWTEILPMRAPRRKAVDLYWIKLLYEEKDKILVSKNQKGEWWESLWDFPKLECKSLEEVQEKLRQLQVKHGKKALALNAQKHTVTHHRIHVYPVILSTKQKVVKGAEFHSREKILNLPLSSLAKKILNSLDA